MRLQSTVPETVGIVNLTLYHFQNRNWYLSQRSCSPTAHERNILLRDKKLHSHIIKSCEEHPSPTFVLNSYIVYCGEWTPWSLSLVHSWVLWSTALSTMLIWSKKIHATLVMRRHSLLTPHSWWCVTVQSVAGHQDSWSLKAGSSIAHYFCSM